MQELDNRQIPTSEILSKRKRAIVNLIEEMIKNLPPMVQIMVTQYRSTVCQFVDKLTYEQTEELIGKVENVLDELRG